MASFIYNGFREYEGDGTIDLDGDTFKICLLDDGHTPSAEHDGYADVSADELANGNGYTTGGETLGSVTWTRSGASVTFDAADVTWSDATFTARYGVVYSDTSTGDKLCFLIDFTENKVVSTGTFIIAWHADGIYVKS